MMTVLVVNCHECPAIMGLTALVDLDRTAKHHSVIGGMRYLVEARMIASRYRYRFLTLSRLWTIFLPSAPWQYAWLPSSMQDW